MATKIINILQDDSFEGILKIFKETPATEVIFILPKKHDALNNEDHFAILAEAAKENNKSPLILASNPDINAMALQYNIGILTSAKVGSGSSIKKTKKPVKLNQEIQPKKIPVEDVQEERSTEEASNSKKTISEDIDEEGDISLEPLEPNRMMVDIIQPPKEREEKFSVEIEESTEELPMEVQIKKEERSAIDEIQSVWRSRSSIDRPTDDDNRPPVLIKNGFRVDFPPFLRFLRKPLVLLGMAVVIIFGTVLYVSTGSAKIIIKPRSQSMDFSLKIATADTFLTVDLQKKQIPGQLFSVDKKVEETFPATGERDVVQKARGKLTVYNEYGTTPQVLIATTRFESSSGLVFRTLKTITVPGTTVQNGKITPGKIEVEIIADKAGDTYNIDPGRFTIPAFKEKGDNDRYQKFYAISEDPIKGGIIGKAKVVTEQDFLSAKKKIEERMLSETEQDLRSQAAGLKILDLTQPTVKNITSTAQIDEAIGEFIVSGTAQLQTVGFKESDLNDFLIQYVGEINNFVVLPEKLKVDFADIEFSDSNKTLGFIVSVKGPAYNRLDEDKIITDLIGKDENSIKEYIKGIEGIASARVVLSPFWVRKVPVNKSRIKMELQYE